MNPTAELACAVKRRHRSAIQLAGTRKIKGGGVHRKG